MGSLAKSYTDVEHTHAPPDDHGQFRCLPPAAVEVRLAVVATLSKGHDLDYIWKQIDLSPAKDAAGYYIQASETGGSHSCRRRRRVAAALAGFGALAALSLLAACFAAGSSHSHAGYRGMPSGTAGDPERMSWPVSGQAAGVLYYYVPATGAQYTIGAQFSGIYSAFQDDIVSACMARSGFHLPRTPAAVYIAQDFDNSQWPDLAAISRTGSLNPGLQHGLPEITVPGNKAVAYQADYSRCEKIQQQTFAPLVQAGTNLLGPWLDIVSKIQASEQLRTAQSGFSTCVERAHTPAKSVGSFDYFLAWVTGLTARVSFDEGLELF
jgi:hypothetical protein